MIFRRDRFADLLRRQLDVFAEDETELLHEAEQAERAYDDADVDDAEEVYGDYQLTLEAIGDRLAELRDTYAATLDEDAAGAYEQAFGRAARKRFSKLAARLWE
jgi:cyclopropane fatty-acyl-phospholipid synthase-like methyltransferase